MRKLFSFITVLILGTVMMMAQTKTLTGRVISAEDGEPVVGASVIVPDTQIGATTDIDGNYSLKVPESTKSLRISFVGMQTKNVPAKNKIEIMLDPEHEVLDDVVVVAYGTQRKTSLTGAIQSVKSENIEIRPTSSATSALEGTVAGVQVNSTYGSPGSDPSIRIRGTGTVNGSSTPLYVIDGVPFGGNISDINPADIESMSVLKDAASAALYGNRASNGVILITTKRGKNGRMNVSLDIKQGTYMRGIPEYKLLGADRWMEAQWQNLKNFRMSSVKEDEATAAAYASANLIADNVKLNIYNKADNALFTADGKLVNDATILAGYRDDLDWNDQAVRNGYRQEYNVSVNGASEKADYLLSFGYLDENGYLKDSGFDRFSARVSLNAQPKKWVRLGLNVAATHQNYENSNGGSDGSYTNVFMYARSIAPVYPVHLHDVETGEYILDANGEKRYDGGTYYYTEEGGKKTYYQDKVDNVPANATPVTTRVQMADRHVMWENELNKDVSKRNTINGIAYADFMLPYNFVVSIKGNLNVRNNANQTYNSAIIGDGKGNDGRGKRVDYWYKNYQFQQQIHWNHEYGKHTVDALLAHENYYNTYNYLYGYKTSETFSGINNLNNFNEITSLYDYNATYSSESYLARVRYEYDDRYNVEGSWRRDGSSRFAKDARWGSFWSVGANWILSHEKFMNDVKWVDMLKLRADYGEVGNDASAGYYGYKSLYASTQHANQGAYYINQLPNDDLKWETSQSWGIAVEASMFKRWNLTIEYFDKRNKDLIFDVYNPLSAGGTGTSAAESVVTKNLGTISNRGWEISTDVVAYRNKDWKINVGANATFLKNKVVTLPEQNKDGIVETSYRKIVEGRDRYSFFTYTWEGIDTYNGKSVYKFNDADYFFEKDGQKFGNTEGTAITGTNLDNVVIINGKPYAYSPTYAMKEFHGKATPTVYGSFNFDVAWKSLTLSALFTYQIGGKVMDFNYQSLMQTSGNVSSLHEDALKSWTTADKTADHALDANGTPVLDNNLSSDNNTTSSRWLQDASYLCFKNLNIGYSLPKKWVKKADLSAVNINVTFENLFTAATLQGMNPQQSYNGTQYNYFVTPRVFSVGLNVKF